MASSLLIFTAFVEMPQYKARWTSLIIVIQSLCIILLVLNRRGYTRCASLGLIIGLWAIVTGADLTGGGIATSATFVYVIIVYIAGILLGARAGIFTALFCIFTALCLVLMEINGYMPSKVLAYTPMTRWTVLTMFTGVMIGLQYLASQVINDALLRTQYELDERNRAEDALRRSETRWRTVFNNAVVSIALVDERGHILESNPAMQRLLGYSREELGRMTFLDFTHSDDRVEDLTYFKEMFDGKSNFYRYEKRYIRKDGQLIWANLTASIIYEEHGKGQFAVGMVEDITDRKHTEEENRKLLWKLKERIKELTGLHEAARILQRQMTDIPQMLHDLAKLLPPAFQYPKATAARIRLGQIETATAAFAASSDALRTDFTTADGLSGSIEVIYTEDYPLETEGPFLAEERALINTLADMLQTSYDRHQAEEQLKTTTDQLRALTVRLRHAREEEGARIAREIHDELGSALTSLRWELESINNTSDGAEKQLKPQPLREKTGLMMNQIDATINVVRRIASELRPSILDDLGLMEAIEWQAQQFQERTRIFCRCRFSPENIDLNEEQSTAVFRIFQESLTNILRHARATSVDITSEKRGGCFILTIRDDGQGIAEHESTGTKSLGILGMRERVFLVGGAIEIAGVEGKGTILTVRVPISG